MELSAAHPEGTFAAVYEGSRPAAGYMQDLYRMPDGRVIYHARFSGDAPELGTRYFVTVRIMEYENRFYNTVRRTYPPLWFWSI